MPSNKSIDAALELIKQDPSKILGLTVGKHEITEPGQYVPRVEYTIINLDIDAPFPSFPKLGPILHWVQTGVKPSAAAPTALDIANPTQPFIANYIGPAPPPLSAPHRYVFFVYEGRVDGEKVKGLAPDGGSGKTLGNGGRLWASLDEWEEKLGVKGGLVGVNWFNSN